MLRLKVSLHTFATCFLLGTQRRSMIVLVLVILVVRCTVREICPGSELLGQAVQVLEAPGDREEGESGDVSCIIHRVQGAGRH